MIGLDTNILLRWLVDESIWPSHSRQQTAAANALLGDATQRFYANSVVISEIMWVLERPMKQSKRVLIDVLDRMLATSNLMIQCHEAVAAARRSFEKHKGGVHDRLIAELNSHAGCDWTATFDITASKAPGFRLLRSRG